MPDFLTHPIAISLGISMLIQAGFFAIAATFKTDKVTDLSYGLTFVFLAIYWLVSNSEATGALKYLFAAMVSIWGVRLSGYLLIRIFKTGKDDRFDDKRDDFVKFAKFWILQGLSVWVIMIPSVYVLSFAEELSIGIFAIAGGLIWLCGVVVETVADIQLYRFRFHKETGSKWIDEGLWHYSRHPNYFGEMVVWWGVFLAGAAVYQGLAWLVIVGPIYITLLLRYVSGVPLLEKKNDKRWGDIKEYRQYKKTTNLLIIGPKG